MIRVNNPNPDPTKREKKVEPQVVTPVVDKAEKDKKDKLKVDMTVRINSAKTINDLKGILINLLEVL